MNQEKKYHQLEQDLEPYLQVIGQAADAVIAQEVSNYPIFVVHQLEVDLGIPLIVRTGDEGPKWSVNASSLEELATKKVIMMDRVEEFRRVYKDPEEYLCLFVLSDLGAQFIFLPRKQENA